MSCNAFKDQSGTGFICTNEIIDLELFGEKCFAEIHPGCGVLFTRKKKNGEQGAELPATKKRCEALERHAEAKKKEW